MKNLLRSTAVALLFATPIFAESHTAMTPFVDMSEISDYYASNLIGARIYTSESEVTDGASADMQAEWDNIGEINDVLISSDGEIKAVLLDIGGFLSMGEKTVAISMDQLRVVADPDNADDWFFVVTTSPAMLENAPEFVREDHGMVNMTQETSATTTSMENDAQPTMWARPDTVREGYNPIEVAELTTEDLDGATVYGSNDEAIGEISSLIVTEDGTITKAIVDVGGFLGMGEHRIAIAFDEIQVLRKADGSDVSIHVNATQEALEQRPEYDG